MLNSPTSNRWMRKNNIIIFDMPEPNTNIKNETVIQDKTAVLDMCRLTNTFEPSDIKECTRLGRKSEEKKRPLKVTFNDESAKGKLMVNMHKLRTAAEPYRSVRIKHDLTPLEQDDEKKLWAKARKMDQDEPNFVHLVKGNPPLRKIHTFPRDPARPLRTQVASADQNAQSVENNSSQPEAEFPPLPTRTGSPIGVAR